MAFQRQLTLLPTLVVGLAFLFIGFAVIGIADLISDFVHGGRRWQQGDWLINSLSEPVRRGTLGTAIILASDVLGVSPLALVVAIQIGVVLALALVFFHIAVATVTHPIQMAVFLLPPFYPMMMVSRFDGMIYKDVLAVLAISVLALAVVRPDLRYRLAPTGVIVFIVACFSHEALVFFLPVAVWLTFLSMGWSKNGKVLMVLLMAGAGAAFVFSVVYSRANPDAICFELTSRGLGEHLCAGPVGWLNASLEYAVEFTFEELEGKHVVQFIWVWGASVLVVGYLWGISVLRGIALGVLTLVPFLPLFPIALDFGRWFAFAFVSFLLVVVTIERPPVQFDKRRGVVALGAVMCSLAMTYDSTAGVYWSGLVNRALALLG